MLKDIVDETSHGKYDFMYLRIGTSALAKLAYTPLTQHWSKTSPTTASMLFT